MIDDPSRKTRFRSPKTIQLSDSSAASYSALDKYACISTQLERYLYVVTMLEQIKAVRR